MPYWAVYDVATGELRSRASVLPDPLPSGLAAKDVTTDPGGAIWDPAAKQFNPRPTETSTFLALVESDPDYLSFTATNRRKIAGILTRAGGRVGVDVSEQRPVA